MLTHNGTPVKIVPENNTWVMIRRIDAPRSRPYAVNRRDLVYVDDSGDVITCAAPGCENNAKRQGYLCSECLPDW